jgi:hypothetical protein
VFRVITLSLPYQRDYSFIGGALVNAAIITSLTDPHLQDASLAATPTPGIRRLVPGVTPRLTGHNAISHRTVAVRSRSGQQQAHRNCTLLAPGVLVRVKSEQRCGTRRGRPEFCLFTVACTILSLRSVIRRSSVLIYSNEWVPR